MSGERPRLPAHSVTTSWTRKLRRGRPGSLPRPTAVLEGDPELTPGVQHTELRVAGLRGLLAPQNRPGITGAAGSPSQADFLRTRTHGDVSRPHSCPPAPGRGTFPPSCSGITNRKLGHVGRPGLRTWGWTVGILPAQQVPPAAGAGGLLCLPPVTLLWPPLHCPGGTAPVEHSLMDHPGYHGRRTSPATDFTWVLSTNSQ